MGGSCHHRCVKGFLYLINVVFFATGLMLLIVSSLSITQTNLFKEFLPYLPSLIVVYQGVYLIIFAGCFLFLIGFLGCWGSIKENRIVLYMFLGLTVVTMLTEIIGAIIAFCYYPQAKHFMVSTMDIYRNEEIISPCMEIGDEIKKELCFLQKQHQVARSNWVEILTDGRWKSNQNETNLLMDLGSPIVTVIWNDIQTTGQCCGMGGQQDWLDSNFGKIPPSCCNKDNLKNRTEVSSTNKEVTRHYCQIGDSNFPGCEMRAQKYVHLTGVVFFIVLIFQFLMIAFTVSFIKILVQKVQYI